MLLLMVALFKSSVSQKFSIWRLSALNTIWVLYIFLNLKYIIIEESNKKNLFPRLLFVGESIVSLWKISYYLFFKHPHIHQTRRDLNSLLPVKNMRLLLLTWIGKIIPKIFWDFYYIFVESTTTFQSNCFFGPNYSCLIESLIS